MYAAAGGTDKDEVSYRVFLQEVDQRRVVDASVKTAEYERIDTSQRFHCSYSGLGDGADAVVVPGAAGIYANLLYPMSKAFKSGEWRVESGEREAFGVAASKQPIRYAYDE